MLKIGNVKIANKTVLAPMVGVSDIAFRSLGKKFGAGLVCTEMVNVNAICRRNKSTLKLMKTVSSEKPVCVQLFGAKTDLTVEAAKVVADSGADIIDFNRKAFHKVLT